jgi:hypothetical protein
MNKTRFFAAAKSRHVPLSTMKARAQFHKFVGMAYKCHQEARTSRKIGANSAADFYMVCATAYRRHAATIAAGGTV